MSPLCHHGAEIRNRASLPTNLGVGGSNPPRRANFFNGLRKLVVGVAVPCQHYVSAKPGNSGFSALLRRGRALLIEVEEAGDRKLESPCFWAKPIGRRFYLTSKSDGGHTSFPRFLHRMLSIQISKRLTMYSRPSISGYQPPSRSLTRGHVPVSNQ